MTNILEFKYTPPFFIYLTPMNISKSISSILFSMLLIPSLTLVSPSTEAFSKESQINNPSLKILEQKDIFSKKDKNKKFPAKEIMRRGEFLQWTLNNAGFSVPNFKNGYEPFSDIRKNQKIYPFVASAYASGALTAYEGKKKFLPNRTISRLEAMQIVFAVEGISTFQRYSRNYDQYKDLPRNSKERAIITTAIDLGYLKAKNNAVFPKRKITKGEVVYILSKISRKKVQKKQALKKTPLGVTQKIILQNSLQKKDISSEKLEEEALKGMMDSLGDRYSVYMPPKNAESFNDFINNSSKGKTSKYAGIGVAVVKKDKGGLVVTEIFNGPAKKAGIMTGDEIIEVEGKDVTHFKSSSQITSLIKGVVGTQVSLGIIRNNQKILKKITRGSIDISGYTNVKTTVKDDIVWVKVHAFKRDTAAAFAKTLRENISEKTKGLVIDLRYNSGGLLSASQRMLGELLPEKSLTVRMKNGDGIEKKLEVKGSGNFTATPLVVVQNEYSASASEIFSGSIKDYERGTIIGKNSFGKGVAQNLYHLSNGGQIKLTTNEFFTPLGNKVHGVGIAPDKEILKGDDATLWNAAKRIFR